MRDVSGQVAVGIGNVQVGSVHGGVVNIATQGTVSERPRPISVRPRPPAAVFGRTEVVAELLSAIADREPATLVGEPGMGKTTLLRALAHAEGGAGEDGVAYVSA